METVFQVVMALLLTVMAVAFLLKFTKEFMDAVGIAAYGLVSLSKAHRATLERWNAYYRTLDHAQRKEFDRRVKELLYEKDWLGKGFPVSWEMRVRIAGTMAQVTLGLERVLLRHFTRIHIFPGAYVNKRTGRRHLGEVNPAKRAIVLSWAHFQEGHANPADGRNLGLHETAHALWLENSIENGEDDFLETDLRLRWQELAREEIARINAGEERFFRKYAGTNQAEFFAVAVENFFERPLDYQATLPDLYACMKDLLRQDPAGHGPGSPAVHPGGAP